MNHDEARKPGEMDGIHGGVAIMLDVWRAGEGPQEGEDARSSKEIDLEG